MLSYQEAFHISSDELNHENKATISIDAFTVPISGESLRRKGNVSAMTTRYGRTCASLAVRTSVKNQQTKYALLDTTWFKPYGFCNFVITDSS